MLFKFRQYFVVRHLKKAVVLLVLLCFFRPVFSQDAFFDWAKQLDRRQGSEEAYCMGVDDDKNVYMAGGFRYTIDLDPGPGVFNVTALPLDHIYIVKLSPAGDFIWGKEFGGNRFTRVKYLHVDGPGNIYISGMFSGTTDFDPGPGTHEFTAIHTDGTENYDMFTLKLDKDGNFKWATYAGNLNVDVGYCVTADMAGNTYTAGTITGAVDFDPGTGQTVLGVDGVVNSFISKFDSQGNFIWAKEFKGNSYCMALCIRVDPIGNIYVSGKFDGTVDFDPGPSVHSLSSPFNVNEPYITKLNPAGNFIWVKKQGGSWFVVSDDQQIFSFNTSSGFQGTLEKYDIDGNILWTKIMGGRPSTWPEGNGPIAIGPGNNIFLTGEFNYTTDFDPSPATYYMTAYGGGYNYDAFLCRLDPDGNLIWAKQMGGFSEEHPTSIAVDLSGSIYSTGIFNNRIDFDPGPGVFEMEAYPGGGTYIHKLQRCQGATYHSLHVNTCSSYTLNNHTYTQTGTYTQTLPNTTGCDSIITLDLVVENNTTDVLTTSCDSYVWNGNVISTSGVYTHTYTSVNGCDSIVRLHLTIRNSTTSTINKKICEGMQYEGYVVTGVYTDHFISANGCDSTRILNLEVIPKKYTTINVTVCSGETYGGHNSSGTYTGIFTGYEGCDSIRILHLLVNPTYNFSVTKSICRGENYLGHTTTGIYTDHFQTESGCDSVQTTQLTVLDKPKPVLGKDTIICFQDSLILRPGGANSFIWQDGSTNNYFVVRSPGIYKVTASNSCGNTTATITIGEGPCSVYFPSAFTPNGDGKNDRFGILNARLISDYRLVVYDRWGEIVFETRNPLIGWDGKIKGITPDTGIFVWQCSFKDDGQAKNLKGIISLIK